MPDFQNFVLNNCILIFNVVQVYFKLQVNNFKNNKVFANPKPKPPKK